MDRISELGFHILVIPESVPDAILIYGYFHGRHQHVVGGFV